MATLTDTPLVERVCRHGHVGKYEMRSGIARCGDCRRGEARKFRSENLESERTRQREAWRNKPIEDRRAVIDGRDPEMQRRYVAANREKVAALQRAWYEANSFVVKQRARLRRAQYKLGDLTESQWIELVAACDGRCLACGRDDLPLSVDHVLPLSKGGEHTLSNVQPLCLPCNKSKFTKTVDYRIPAVD